MQRKREGGHGNGEQSQDPLLLDGPALATSVCCGP